MPEQYEDSAVNGNEEGLFPAKKVFELMEKDALTCAKYDKQKFFTPFYSSQVQYAEGFFLLESAPAAKRRNVPDKRAFTLNYFKNL